MGKVMFMRKGEVHTAPVAPGIPAGELAVGSSVFINVNGVPKEFLVVHRGLPSSSYDSSCDGVWLLMKDIYENRARNSSDQSNYHTSTIHSYLNGDFLALLDAKVQNIIKTAKIPCSLQNGSAYSGGLSTKIFLLAALEVGFTSGPSDGACLNYFSGATNTKRVAYLNGTATAWWLRSPYTSDGTKGWCVMSYGSNTSYTCSSAYGIRPALILPYDALFDEETMVLRGA